MLLENPGVQYVSAFTLLITAALPPVPSYIYTLEANYSSTFPTVGAVFAQKIIGKSHFTPLRIIEGWSIVNVHNCLPLTIRIRKHGERALMMKSLVELIQSRRRALA